MEFHSPLVSSLRRQSDAGGSAGATPAPDDRPRQPAHPSSPFQLMSRLTPQARTPIRDQLQAALAGPAHPKTTFKQQLSALRSGQGPAAAAAAAAAVAAGPSRLQMEGRARLTPGAPPAASLEDYMGGLRLAPGGNSAASPFSTPRKRGAAPSAPQRTLAAAAPSAGARLPLSAAATPTPRRAAAGSAAAGAPTPPLQSWAPMVTAAAALPRSARAAGAGALTVQRRGGDPGAAAERPLPTAAAAQQEAAFTPPQDPDLAQQQHQSSMLQREGLIFMTQGAPARHASAVPPRTRVLLWG
jgi:hypothetical protein